MKFVTDLGKGVLGQADPVELWEEITANIPDSVLLKPGVKILSIACGHGTEATVIAKRMIALGINKEQVNNSIYLIDKYHVFANEVKSKYGFKNVISCDFLEWETDMKFDVVVGNPPYQNSSTDAGNFAIWPLFIKKANELLADGGIMSMIVPQTWAANKKIPSSRAQITATIRRDVFDLGHLSTVNFNIGHHFNVGSTFSYFVWYKSSKKKLTEVITPNGNYSVDYGTVQWLKVKMTEVKSIKKPKLKLVNGGKETPGFRNGSITIGSGKFKIANTSAQYSNGDYLSSSVKHPFQNTKKVIFSDSGYSKPFYDDGKLGLGHHARAFIVESESEAKKVIDFLNSEYIADLASTIPDSGSSSSLGKLINVGFFDCEDK